ncbi:MAG TPA: hypothetical protein VFJ43_13415 [Bacteroidia bacterium]|nr:hypothetical protein [Bacteroidia bacterium]
MKKLLILLSPVFLFACKSPVTKEQSDAYDSCKKIILDNQKLFLAGATTKEKEDSLKEYLNDLEKCNLDQLVDKYDVEPEQVNVLIYSVCEKAQGVKNLKTVEDELLKTDSLIKSIDK